MIDRRKTYQSMIGHIEPGHYVERVMAQWRTGQDTAAMSIAMMLPEALCERALHIGLQRRREQREWDNAARC